MRGSPPCRHGTSLSEHCWQCDIDAQHDAVAEAVKAERERVLGLVEEALKDAHQSAGAVQVRFTVLGSIQRIREEAGK